MLGKYGLYTRQTPISPGDNAMDIDTILDSIIDIATQSVSTIDAPIHLTLDDIEDLLTLADFGF